MMVPPVVASSAAISLKVILSSVSVLDLMTPFSISMESASMSQICEALSIICLLTSCAASCAAQPVAYATRLPPVTSV